MVSVVRVNRPGVVEDQVLAGAPVLSVKPALPKARVAGQTGHAPLEGLLYHAGVQKFRFFRYDHGPGGGSGPGSHGSGYGGGSSGLGFHGNQSGHGNQGNQGNQGGYNHQGSQQQQQQSGYQSNPKQLNSGQYHVFTTSLCERD